MKKLLFLFLLFIRISVFSQDYSQLKKLVASDRASGDQFGIAVAISGNYAVVGSSAESEDTSGTNTLTYAGSAYIFERYGNGNWIQKQKIVPSDRAKDDYFGTSVAIDSNRIVVGAYEKNAIGDKTYSHAGAIYVFERGINGVWSETQKLLAADTSAATHFGYAVSISGDYIVSGSPLESEDSMAINTVVDAGAVYIFKHDVGGGWNQVKKIVASDRAASDYFGAAVSISGNTIFIGAYAEDEDSVGLNTISQAGSAYIFEKTSSDQWYQSQKIVSKDRGTTDRFGSAVCVSGDKAVMGVYLEDEDEFGTSTMGYAGSAYIFERNANGKWYQKQKIVASDRDMNNYFGISAQIDGDLIIVGAEQESEDIAGVNTIFLAGAAYIFERSVTGIWSERQKIVCKDRASIDLFGHVVAVSQKHIIIGAYPEDEDEAGGNPLNAAGAAYIFEPCTKTNSIIYDTACYSYTSPSGKYVWTISNTYYDTVLNVRGCDSTLTIFLTIITSVNTGVTSSGITLTAAAAAAEYQWVDCNNAYALIPGASNQSYTAINNGDYAVIVTESGCIDTSICYTINSVGLKDVVTTSEIPSIYPNPNTGRFYISTNKNASEIRITNVYGKQVCHIERIGNTAPLELNLAKGIYFISINVNDKIKIEKLIIE